MRPFHHYISRQPTGRTRSLRSASSSHSPTNLRNSPGCGVNIEPAGTSSCKPGSAANKFSASASITIGLPHCSRASKARAVWSRCPNPGPTPIAVNRWGCWGKCEKQGCSSPLTIAAGWLACSATRSSLGRCTVTSPHPERSSSPAANTAAPTIPSEPQTNKAWPKHPLCPKRGRGNNILRINSSST